MDWLVVVVLVAVAPLRPSHDVLAELALAQVLELFFTMIRGYVQVSSSECTS